MNYLLLLVIVGICGGAYYENSLLQTSEQQKAAADQKLSDATSQLDQLQDENKKLEADKTELEQNLKDAQAKTGDLTAQIQKASEPAKPPTASGPATMQTIAPKALSNNLGTIVTLDAKTFQNCQLLKVETDGITFTHSAGITKVMFPMLPLELQKRFGFDPHQGLSLTDEQVQFQESQRETASQASGN